MICGIGIDIIEIARIQKAIENNPAFCNRIFTDREIAYCESKANPSLSYAVRFAAKEAFMKALGTGWNNEVSWLEIETITEENGRPIINVTGKTEIKMKSKNVSSCYLSLSHEKDFAIANVVLESS